MASIIPTGYNSNNTKHMQLETRQETDTKQETFDKLNFHKLNMNIHAVQVSCSMNALPERNLKRLFP